MEPPRVMPASPLLPLLRDLASRRFPFVLDAGESPRPSFAGADPSMQLIVHRDGRSSVWRGRYWEHIDAHPLEAIDGFVTQTSAGARVTHGRFDVAEPTPARVVGYLAYELGTWIEKVPAVAADPVGAPLAMLSVYPRVEASDPLTGATATLEFAGGAARKSDLPVPRQGPRLLSSPPVVCADADPSRESYHRGFARIQAAIDKGEIYQANLTRTIRRSFDGDPVECFLRLCARQPTSHGAYLDLHTLQILSNSPECFVEIHGDRIATYPIKGTRPRMANPADDAAAITALSEDPKELAEHIMIVDLERNDLGRICETGSVAVHGRAAVMSLATVHHLVSGVSGRLRADAGLADILRSTFPGGSVTGAPKIQAMHTIAEVETAARGIYTGAIGGFNGPRRVELNLAIRTAVVANSQIAYGTGGGIVADSRLDAEYAETVTKAQAFLDSLDGPGIVGDVAPLP